MTTRSVQEILLNKEEAAQARRLADGCVSEYGDVENPDFWNVVTVVAGELPKRVRAEVNRARLDDRLHALVIRNNSIDQGSLEPTPPHWSNANTPGSQRYAFLVMIYAALMGDAISWATQQGARMVTDVLPTPGLEDSTVSASSHLELGWHVEDAFSPYRADHVSLFCLRSPQRTSTTISFVNEHNLSLRARDVLRQPRFHLLPDEAHTAGFSDVRNDHRVFDAVSEARQQPPAVALIEGHQDAPRIRIDRDFTVAVAGDTEAARVLDEVIREIDGNVYDLLLAGGDVGIIDNANVVHGRRPFVPRYDGTDRWLKRVNTVRDIRRTRPGRPDDASRTIG